MLTGLVVIQFTVGKVKIKPRILGKIATVLQIAGIQKTDRIGARQNLRFILE
ncbi:MAG TPA: hypothetical protein VN578_18905 [Candidatus Binatia bacterium]|nr:hypothetical protein [Candidatus Binatia bacterium]